ncbi:SDR family NAD(P)-dependent oxidoreductase [Haloplasma contractile]|uniref:Short-chain dehydrogenase of various substrate specificities ral function prediction only protein n=1 Tax=Haloplasma contractile SSD-17B TaxID=1033810 RepID=U2EGM2_9MOLU|nr:SDR family NAD(P)-dependent oxidoreductase [Haloplasma contractile]ERJ13766.1 Short-chain dehydrogenase of various substrate specificities ral function prediction only protein [Haloplasma contractile SSD-17B]
MNYTIITGATSGIGKELAFKYASNGFNLILIARRSKVLDTIKRRLQGKYNVSIAYVSCDLSSLEDTIKVFKQLNETYSIECLINNAGIAFFKPVGEIELSELTIETNLNVNVPILTTKLCVGNLREHNGSVINICSILSYLPNAGASVYVATKHALLGFSNSLRLEEPGLHVLTVHPITVKTNFFNNDSYLKQKRILDAKNVAHAIFKSHQKRKRHLHLPKSIPFLRSVYVLMPRLIDLLNKRFYSKK